MTDERIQAWFDGDIEDDELTQAEILDLHERVMEAVSRKVLARPDVHTFPEHRSLQ